MKAKLDLHTHTISSGHAYSTLGENIIGALSAGIEVMGMSDHASSMPGGPHPFYFLNLKVIPDIMQGVRILKGIEANIMDFNGSIDVKPYILEKMDYVIASLHPPVLIPGEITQNTNALVQVMQLEKVKIIGHPDDGRYPIDYEKVVLEAKKTKTLLEINNASLNPEGSRENTHENAIEILRLCKLHEVPVILGSDAHIAMDVGNFDNCMVLIHEIDFPYDLVVNFDVNFFSEYTQIKIHP
ncbi:MAG: phosphatase [Clostridia bacterium]|nr:phosphatase [Clostridia bacterium]